jgi:putative ABC transport system substrate-binding protein
MRRRAFMTLLAGAASAAPALSPFTARAQQPVPLRPLIGFLSPLSAKAAARNVAAFRSGLRDLGYFDGRNATFDLHYGDGAAENMDGLVRELLALKPDVLFVSALSGTRAAHDATREIPIVTIIPVDPVASGFANSIARPGGNITGMWTFGDYALVGKRLNFLKLAVPSVERLGLLANPDDPNDSVQLAQLPSAARALGLDLQTIAVRDSTKLEPVAAEIGRAGVQGLFISQGPTFNSARQEIAAMVARLKLPAVYGFREFADAGGLMSYGPNLPDMYRQAARLVDRILKGANPGDLPFELPTRYELVVNLKAAKSIELTISDSFLLLADEVIE